MATTAPERDARALLKRYRSPAVLLHRPYPPQSAPTGRSFFGGLPTLPNGFEWPRTTAGVPLHFLCQVDCSVIGWATPLPDRGLLFFFGRDDEEQVWGQGAPQDDCRVIYASEVPTPDQATQPPPDLPPIGWEHPRSPFRGIALETDPPRRLHVKWPIQPLSMDSYPDLSELPPLVAHRERVSRRFNREFKIRKFLRRVLPQISPFPRMIEDSPDQPIWDWYEEILPVARAQALEQALRESTYEDTHCFPGYYGAERTLAEPAFPYSRAFIHFFARAVLRRHRSTGAFDHPAPTPGELEEKARAEEQLDIKARNWFERSCAAPMDDPDDNVHREFRSWAANLERRPLDAKPSVRALDWSRAAALWTVREAAGDRDLASKIPASAYDCVADLFQLSRVQRGEDKDWYDFQFSQLLGHAPASQEAKPADHHEICLLNIASDTGLGWSFGDAGECSFWITPADLAARDFSRVRGTIEGY